jgi:hypothetical protein
MTKHEAVNATAGRVICASEIAQVSGGSVGPASHPLVLEKENLYPRKPGGVEVAVYVEGIYMGTATINRDTPIGPFNPPVPNN